MLVSLASCSSGSNEATYVDITSNSPYGKITDFSLENEGLKEGDVLTFKVNPNDDFLIDKVTVNGKNAIPLLGEPNTYQFTLEAGSNRISAIYKINSTIDFVDRFKLNVSDETFAKLMQKSNPDNANSFDFRTDGIELVRTPYLVSKKWCDEYFMNYVDGDTTHVETLKYGYTIKVRYLGIDTPESSSDLEEWGKSAAIFNQSRLENAKYILLQSQGRAMYDESEVSADEYESLFSSTVDGNGRNLAYVWYTNEEEPTKDDFRCLNLEMVYEGFSQGIGSVEEQGENYYYAFDKANLSAEANKRHQYTDVPMSDPNYCYNKPTDLELSQIYETSSSPDATDSIYNDEKTLYRISGYVTRKVEGAFYFQNFPDYTYEDSAYWDEYGASGYNEDKLPTKAYGMYVFTYSQTPIKTGDYVTVIGVLTNYGGAYQMSGISYTEFDPDLDRDTTIDYNKSVSTREIKPIELTASQFKQMQYNNVLVHLTEKVYPYNADNGHGTLCEGGLYEVNKYNTTYPFYNDNNKIICYVDTVANSTASPDNAYRMVVSQEILLDYQGEYCYSYQWLTGGENPYYSDPSTFSGGAQYLYEPTRNREDLVLKDESEWPKGTQVFEYDAKVLDLTCISQHYLSTSEKTSNYTLTIVDKNDVIINLA